MALLAASVINALLGLPALKVDGKIYMNSGSNDFLLLDLTLEYKTKRT